jgi:tetratricopeptide (TPR) repeat protein
MKEINSPLRSLLIILLSIVPITSCGLGRGPGITPVRTAFNRGVYHYSRGNFEEARSEFLGALGDDETDYRARFNLALVFDEEARRARAAHDPDLSATLMARAREQYTIVLASRPTHLRAQVNLAACEYDAGERAAAEKRLRQALGDHSDSALVHVSLASLLLREARSSGSQDVGEVLTLLDAALALDAANAGANWLLGECHGYLADRARSTSDQRGLARHLDAARASYGRLLDGQPDDLAGLFALALLEVDAGEYAASVSWLERILHIDPDNREAHVVLAGALELLGDLEGATTHLWAARRLAPEAERATMFRDRLLNLYDGLKQAELKKDRDQ